MKAERIGIHYQTTLPSKCLVCEHPDGGSAHFGSTSCLACAAFFRRTVSLNIQFVCKKERSCTIYHELRMICRACRFTKCLAAGMKRECVQKRRSNKKIPKKHLKNEMLIEHEKKQQQQQQPKVTMDVEDVKFDCGGEQTDDNSPMSIDKKSPMMLGSPEFSMPSTSFATTPSSSIESPTMKQFKIINMDGCELLRFYVDQLKHAMDRRRMIYTDSPLLAVIEDRGDVPFDICNPPPHDLKRQYVSQKFDNLLAFDFCKSCPGFDLFNEAERAIFYRSCSLAYCLLDIAWITVQAFQNQTSDEKTLVMFTDGSVSTVDDMSYGWEDEEDINAVEKKNLFFSFFGRLHEAICTPLKKMNFTSVEFAALKALCIWKLGYCEFTNRIKMVGKEHEEALLIGLQNYYRDVCEDHLEMAERLGNLIMIMGTVFEMNQLILETYKSAELFSLFKLDKLSKILLSL